MLFAIFGISLVFGTDLEFFSKFSKKDHFQKMNIERLYLLFNLVSLDLTKKRKFPDSLSFIFFWFD